jgi:hypothetical protein
VTAEYRPAFRVLAQMAAEPTPRPRTSGTGVQEFETNRMGWLEDLNPRPPDPQSVPPTQSISEGRVTRDSSTRLEHWTLREPQTASSSYQWSDRQQAEAGRRRCWHVPVCSQTAGVPFTLSRPLSAAAGGTEPPNRSRGLLPDAGRCLRRPTERRSVWRRAG